MLARLLGLCALCQLCGAFRCLVNVHGFHHSGTGAVRSAISQLAASASVMSDHAEAEGQYYQSVYPIFRARTFWAANESTEWPRWQPGCAEAGTPLLSCGSSYDVLYACPGLLRLVTKDNQLALIRSWSRQFDSDRELWIQKTPTFDLEFLDQMVPSSSQVAVMRHPLQYHGSHAQYSAGSPPVKAATWPAVAQWIRTWDRIFRLLFHGGVSRWVIVRYEGIQDAPDLSDWMKLACPGLTLRSRTRRHFNSDAHPPGSVYVPLDSEWKWPEIPACGRKFIAVLGRWFGYRLVNDTEPPCYRRSPFVWADHARMRALSQPDFWHDWNDAWDEFQQPCCDPQPR